MGIHTPRLANVASILWPQQVTQDLSKISSYFQVQGYCSKVIVVNWYNHEQLPLMGSRHSKNGYCTINTLSTAWSTKIVNGQSSRGWVNPVCSHEGGDKDMAVLINHPCSSPHTKPEDSSCNATDSRISRSRSQLQIQRKRGHKNKCQCYCTPHWQWAHEVWRRQAQYSGKWNP